MVIEERVIKKMSSKKILNRAKDRKFWEDIKKGCEQGSIGHKTACEALEEIKKCQRS